MKTKKVKEEVVEVKKEEKVVEKNGKKKEKVKKEKIEKNGIEILLVSQYKKIGAFSVPVKDLEKVAKQMGDCIPETIKGFNVKIVKGNLLIFKDKDLVKVLQKI